MPKEKEYFTPEDMGIQSNVLTEEDLAPKEKQYFTPEDMGFPTSSVLTQEELGFNRPDTVGGVSRELGAAVARGTERMVGDVTVGTARVAQTALREAAINFVPAITGDIFPDLAAPIPHDSQAPKIGFGEALGSVFGGNGDIFAAPPPKWGTSPEDVAQQKEQERLRVEKQARLDENRLRMEAVLENVPGMRKQDQAALRKAHNAITDHAGVKFRMSDDVRDADIFEDTKGTLSNFRWWASGFGEVLPTGLATIIPAVGLAKTATLGRSGAIAVGAFVGANLEAVNVYDESIARGDSDLQALEVYSQALVVSEVLNAAGLEFMLRKLPNEVKGMLLTRIMARGARGSMEGLTEAAEELVQAKILGKNTGDGIKAAATILGPASLMGILGASGSLSLTDEAANPPDAEPPGGPEDDGTPGGLEDEGTPPPRPDPEHIKRELDKERKKKKKPVGDSQEQPVPGRAIEYIDDGGPTVKPPPGTTIQVTNQPQATSPQPTPQDAAPTVDTPTTEAPVESAPASGLSLVFIPDGKPTTYIRNSDGKVVHVYLDSEEAKTFRKKYSDLNDDEFEKKIVSPLRAELAAPRSIEELRQLKAGDDMSSEEMDILFDDSLDAPAPTPAGPETVVVKDEDGTQHQVTIEHDGEGNADVADVRQEGKPTAKLRRAKLDAYTSNAQEGLSPRYYDAQGLASNTPTDVEFESDIDKDLYLAKTGIDIPDLKERTGLSDDEISQLGDEVHDAVGKAFELDPESGVIEVPPVAVNSGLLEEDEVTPVTEEGPRSIEELLRLNTNEGMTPEEIDLLTDYMFDNDGVPAPPKLKGPGGIISTVVIDSNTPVDVIEQFRPPAPAPGVVAVVQDAVLSDMVLTAIEEGKALDGKAFFELADEAYHGTRAEGAYGPSDAYDAMELAVNTFIQERSDPTVETLTEAFIQVNAIQDTVDDLPTQRNRSGEKDEMQQFSTPPQYGYVVAWAANVNENDTVLEPSAGTGGLITHVIRHVRATVVNELSTRRRALLRRLPGVGRAFGEDAEYIHNSLPDKLKAAGIDRPTVIIMNPPFSRAAHRMGNKKLIGNDLRHIDAALELLEDGGRLVAIVGAPMRGEEETQTFKDWYHKTKGRYNIRANVWVERDVYKKYGTTFPTRILIIDKGTATGETVIGKAGYVEQLFLLLEGVRNDRRRLQGDSAPESGTAGAGVPETSSAGRDGTGPLQPHDTPTGSMGPGGTTGRDGDTDGESEGESAPTARGDDAQVAGEERPVVVEPGPESSGERDAGAGGVDSGGNAIQQPSGTGSSGVQSGSGLAPDLEAEMKSIQDILDGNIPEAEPTDTDSEAIRPDSGLAADIEDALKSIQDILNGKLPEVEPEPEPASGLVGAIGELREDTRDIVSNLQSIQGETPQSNALGGLPFPYRPASASLPSPLDPRVWEALVPHFKSIWNSVAQSGGTLRDWISTIISRLGQQIKEYAKHFAQSIMQEKQAERTAVEDSGKLNTDAILDNIYENYKVARVRIAGAKPHPTAIVESAAMASIPPPKPTYSLHLPRWVIDTGILSDIQLEAIVYIGQSFQRWLPAAAGEIAYRMGFMLGDGTGVGKGRIIAGIIADIWHQGTKKAVWISESQELVNATKRDITVLGLPKDAVFSSAKTPATSTITRDTGVYYIPYSSLVASAQAKDGVPGQRRIDQLLDWLGPDFDGVIVFDESHNMSNAIATRGKRGMKEAAQRALRGVELQERLPKAKILYVSATGATEVHNLAYATRLGLWGRGTPFPNVHTFVSAMHTGGIAALELVSQGMKASGKYMARSLAFNDGTPEGTVTYNKLTHELTDEQIQLYDKMAEGWQVVLQNILAAIQLTGTPGRQRTSAMSQFWGGQQRFFNQVLTAMQLPSVVKGIETDLANGKSVVIQLTNTLEEASKRELARIKNQGGDLEDFDLTPLETLITTVRDVFPVDQYVPSVDANGNIVMVLLLDEEGNPVKNAEAVRTRDQLIDDLSTIKVPDSPLDSIINHFGVDNVSEITGRKRRVVRVNGLNTEQKRGVKTRKHDLNAFDTGKTRILIFSEAGGTGVSYHASRDIENQQQRVHYPIQAGWRADKMIQGLGRSHRSNQASAPIYRLTTTNLAGHKRFITTIARRLDQLGALGKGQRETGGSGMFAASDNIESTEAKATLQILLRDIALGTDPKLMSETDFTGQTGLSLRDGNGNIDVDGIPISQFLNRLLCMKVASQNALFEQFDQRLQQTIERAIANNTLDLGVETFKGDSIKKVEEAVVHTDPDSGAQTKYVQVEVQNKIKHVSYAETQQRGREAQSPLYGYVRSLTSGKVYAVLEARHRTDTNTGNVIPQFRLWDQVGWRMLDRSKLVPARYERIPDEDAEQVWNETIASGPQFNERTEHIITGNILPIWDRLTGTVRIYRMQTDAGERLLGRVIPAEDIKDTLRNLGVTSQSAQLTPQQAIARVMSGSVELRLANGWTITRKWVAREQRIELTGPNFTHHKNLMADGVIKEKVGSNTRLFIPTGADAEKVYERVTAQHPLVDVTQLRSTTTPGPDFSNPQAGAIINPAELARAGAALFFNRMRGKKATHASRVLAEINGVPVIDPPEPRDISLAAKLVNSPEFALRRPEHETFLDSASDIIESELFFAQKLHEFKVFEDEAKSGLSKKQQKQVRPVLDMIDSRNAAAIKAAAAADPKVFRAAQQVREYFNVMRERIKEHKRKMYKMYVENQNLLQAFEAVLGGASLDKAVAEGKSRVKTQGATRFKRAALVDLLEGYAEIDDWGIDDYITNIELGSVKLVDQDGTTRAIAVTKRDAVDKAVSLVEGDDTITHLTIQRAYNSEAGVDAMVTRDRSNKIFIRMATLMTKESNEISFMAGKALARRGLKRVIGVEPAPFSAGALKHRKGVLRGEENIFDVLGSYAYSVEKKMAFDAAILQTQRKLHLAPKNIRALLVRMVDDMRAIHSLGDQILDAMLGGGLELLDEQFGTEMALRLKGHAFSRMAARITGSEQVINLGWRPAAAIVNKFGGELHTHTKVGAIYMARATAFLQTKAGQKFISRERELGSMGVHFATDSISGLGSLDANVNIKEDPAKWLKHYGHPLWMFGSVEIGIRERGIAANYLKALDEGMTPAAARTYARRALRTQNFVYNAAAIPQWLRGPGPHIVFQFKTYLVKEIEFMMTLTPREFMKHIGGMLMFTGMRGALYFIRSMPIIGVLFGHWWDKLEELMLRSPNAISTGFPGMAGLDLVAAGIPQMPHRMEDFGGPAISHGIKMYKAIVDANQVGINVDWSNPASMLANYAPLAYYWDQLLGSIYDDEGWIRDEGGNKLYRIDTLWDKMLMGAGIAPIELKKQLLIKRILNREEDQRRRALTATTQRITRMIRRNQDVPPELLGKLDLLSGGRTNEVIMRALSDDELEPDARQIRQTPRFRRGEVADRLEAVGPQ